MSALARALGRIDNTDDWCGRAACGRANPTLFSPLDKRGRVILDDARAVALRYCADCPVIRQCLIAAADSKHGAQEMVQAGMWWPIATSVEEPFQLLDLDTDGAAA